MADPAPEAASSPKPRYLAMYAAVPQGAIVRIDDETVYFFDPGMAWQLMTDLIDPRICYCADARPC